MKIVPEPEGDQEAVALKANQMFAKDRDEVQAMCTGALAMMLVDKTCREPLIALEPSLATFISMCTVLPDYCDERTAERRVDTSRILCSLIQVTQPLCGCTHSLRLTFSVWQRTLQRTHKSSGALTRSTICSLSVQRDATIRRCLIEHGQLKPILSLMLASEGPGQMQMCFSMAAALATLVLDVEVMTLVLERGEAPPMFNACLKVLETTLKVLRLSGSGSTHRDRFGNRDSRC